MTQAETIKKHLEEHGSISTFEAFQRYHITRLSARIWELRHQDGLIISSERKTAITANNEPVTYAVYTMKKGEEA